jgi:hypothetical protein
MGDTFQVYSTAYNALQRSFSAVGNDLCIDHAPSLENAEDRCFTTGARPLFPLIRLAPKYDSSTSISPWKGDDRSQTWFNPLLNTTTRGRRV